jgi:hypothetical protein
LGWVKKKKPSIVNLNLIPLVDLSGPSKEPYTLWILIMPSPVRVTEMWTCHKKGERDDVASAYVLHPLKLLIVSIYKGLEEGGGVERKVLEAGRWEN